MMTLDYLLMGENRHIEESIMICSNSQMALYKTLIKQKQMPLIKYYTNMPMSHQQHFFLDLLIMEYLSYKMSVKEEISL